MSYFYDVEFPGGKMLVTVNVPLEKEFLRKLLYLEVTGGVKEIKEVSTAYVGTHEYDAYFIATVDVSYSNTFIRVSGRAETLFAHTSDRLNEALEFLQSLPAEELQRVIEELQRVQHR